MNYLLLLLLFNWKKKRGMWLGHHLHLIIQQTAMRGTATRAVWSQFSGRELEAKGFGYLLANHCRPEFIFTSRKLRLESAAHFLSRFLRGCRGRGMPWPSIGELSWWSWGSPDSIRLTTRRWCRSISSWRSSALASWLATCWRRTDGWMSPLHL